MIKKIPFVYATPPNNHNFSSEFDIPVIGPCLEPG